MSFPVEGCIAIAKGCKALVGSLRHLLHVQRDLIEGRTGWRENGAEKKSRASERLSSEGWR
jgi:hypothetical protein